MTSRPLLVLASIGAASCTPSSVEPTRTLDPRNAAAEPASSKNASTRDVAEVTKSPWPPGEIDERSATLSASCGAVDGVLVRIAGRLARERAEVASLEVRDPTKASVDLRERARGHGVPDPDRVVMLLREAGEPHVRPRLLSTSGRGWVDDDAVRSQLVALKRPTTRCGVGVARTPQGKELLVGVVVDALADLEPLPIRARTGEWLTWVARVHVSTSNAKLVVLGPRGVPRTVPTSNEPSGLVRARFALEQAGAFTVQLVGDVAGGPQPLLEARVFADTPPRFEEGPAPGEDASASDDRDDADALARMTTALRATESLPALDRDAALDALARTHAEKMRASATIAHDVGDGDLRARFEAEGLAAKVIGENVARSRSVALAHRALHASPSHRMNLLRPDYTQIGVAVVRDAAGNVYACEVFASRLR